MLKELLHYIILAFNLEFDLVTVLYTLNTFILP